MGNLWESPGFEGILRYADRNGLPGIDYERRLDYLVVFNIEIDEELKQEIQSAIFDQMPTINEGEEFGIIRGGSFFLGMREGDQFIISKVIRGI
jgi:hypothetical protein